MIKTKNELEEKILNLYLRHKTQSEKINWNFYEHMPWTEGRSFTELPYNESQNTLPKELILAIETSMLTELNLPWYTTFLSNMFEGNLEPLKNFVHNWVSEEQQHAAALETYLILTRNSDPKKLHETKREMLNTGWSSILKSPFACMVYTSLQELGTVVFYRNVANFAKTYDSKLSDLLIRISKDESAHYAFYNQIVDAHLELDPNQVEYIWPVIRNFKMPGSSLKDFDARMKIIETVGYGPEEYVKQVLEVLVKRWKIESLETTTKEATEAKENILKYIKKLKRINERLKLKKIKNIK